MLKNAAISRLLELYYSDGHYSKLKADETKRFIESSFRDGVLKTTGTDIDKILPPVSRFSKGVSSRTTIKKMSSLPFKSFLKNISAWFSKEIIDL